MSVGTGRNWIQDVLKKKGKKGAPRGAGTLTAQAKQHNMSVPEFAKEVERCPDKYKPITKQRVSLYKTLTKMKK